MSLTHFDLPKPIDQSRLEQLHKLVGKGPALILTHDSPDPDALASGMGLATLFNQLWNVNSRLVYSGLVARAENRAVLSLLTPDWQTEENLPDLGPYTASILVDTQPGAGNNRFPSERSPDVVIDHHYPRWDNLRPVKYVDVRQEIGATSSMVFQYLDAAGIKPEPTLATALFYGLQTDTRGLARGASHEDEAIYLKLLTWIDRPKLVRVEQAGLSRDYFRAFNQGLEAARVYGRCVTAYLGEMHRPDLAAEMADVLIRLESARAVLCQGVFDGILQLSLRTEPSGQDAGLLVQKVIGRRGKAGGHGTMAGGQVHLGEQGALGEPVTLDDLVKELAGRFLELMGEKGDGSALIG
jgi:nanoRNase/pAp phosphatase (c-di-AMP/oligoRNAs hydrolase)